MSWNRGIELFDILSDVVDGIRKTGGINSVVASGSNYLYDVANELSANDYISVTDEDGLHDNLRVISADSTGFTLEENYSTAISYKAKAPYFEHEKIARIAEIYTEKSKSGMSVQLQKYPVVLLVHSYPQTQDSGDFTYSSTFELYLITDSKQEYRSADRYSNNITSKLIPIQNELIQGLADSNYVRVNNPLQINKEWEDLLFIENNPFSDKLDGIKVSITDLEIIDTTNYCQSITPTTFTLTTEAGTGGSVLPEYAAESFEKDANVAIAFVANDGYEIDGITVNNIVQSTNPFVVKMNRNIKAIGTFISVGLNLFMQVFNSIPVQRGLSWFFGDHGTKDNDVEVGNVMVGTFDHSYIDTGMPLIGGQPLDIDIDIDFLGVSSPLRYIFTVGSIDSNAFLVLYNGGRFQILISDAGSFQNVQTLIYMQPVGKQKINITWNGLVGGDVNYAVNGETGSFVATKSWTGNTTNILIGNTYIIETQYSRVKVNELFEYVINHGQGSTISNLLDATGGTDGIITDANLSTFWGSTADNIEPYEATLGCTLYKNDSDNTIMPICVDTSIVKAGFTRLGYFAAGSGVIKGLPNKYYISGVDSVILEGWYTIEELIAYEGANVEITQDTNTVSLFKVSL